MILFLTELSKKRNIILLITSCVEYFITIYKKKDTEVSFHQD